jgi:hypothetical protein
MFILLLYYSGHCDPLTKVLFTTDDKKIISIAGTDFSIIVWDFKPEKSKVKSVTSKLAEYGVGNKKFTLKL